MAPNNLYLPPAGAPPLEPAGGCAPRPLLELARQMCPLEESVPPWKNILDTPLVTRETPVRLSVPKEALPAECMVVKERIKLQNLTRAQEALPGQAARAGAERP
jgi:hypothetical protein